MIDEIIKNHLIDLAQKYEKFEFTYNDPSRVLHRYTDLRDIEIASFISALFSFGRRELFLKKIDVLLDEADKNEGPFNWVKTKLYLSFFNNIENKEVKFYRFYSYQDLLNLLNKLNSILNKSESFGTYIKDLYIEEKTQNNEKEHLSTIISKQFLECAIVPHGRTSANKRVNMFLRWMVRKNSSVDIGMWTWYKSSDLIIPLDTHVLQESIKLGLIKEKSTGTFKTAQELTESLKQIWPDDPCKGDFALFGLGVSLVK